ncbi:unnamed protein product [Closterium sp. NIES-53]
MCLSLIGFHQLGLLIGRSSTASQSPSSSSFSAAAATASGASRDLLFALVPTPKAPGAAAPVAGGTERSGSDSREWRHVDGDWVAEHALQVSRLLLGGMGVLGVYAFCSDAAYSNAAPSLLQALRSLAASLSPPASLTALLPPPPTDLILLHISSFSRRFSARSVATSSPATSATMSPCDFKLAAIPSPILVSSTLSLHAQVPVISSPSLPPPSSSSSVPPSPPPPPPALSPPSVRAAAASALKHIARQMDGGMAFVDGMLVEGGDVVGGESNLKGGVGKAGKAGGGKGAKGGKKGGGRGGKGGGGKGGEEAASEGGSHVRVDWALPPSWNVPLQDGRFLPFISKILCKSDAITPHQPLNIIPHHASVPIHITWHSSFLPRHHTPPLQTSGAAVPCHAPRPLAKDGHVHGMVPLSGSVLALCLAMPRDPLPCLTSHPSIHVVPTTADAKDGHVHGMVALLGMLCCAQRGEPAGWGGPPVWSPYLPSPHPQRPPHFPLPCSFAFPTHIQDGEEEQAEQGERDEAEGGGKERGAGGELKGNAREGGEEEEKTDKVEEEEETERPLLKGKLHRTPFTRWHLPRRVLLRCSVAGGGGRRGGSEGEEEGEGGLLLADYCEMGERAKRRSGAASCVGWGQWQQQCIPRTTLTYSLLRRLRSHYADPLPLLAPIFPPTGSGGVMQRAVWDGSSGITSASHQTMLTHPLSLHPSSLRQAAEDRCGELCGMAAVADEAMREQGIGVEWEGQVEEGEEEQSGMEGSAAPAAVWLPPGTALAKPHSSTRPGSSGSSDTSAVKGQVGEKGSAGRAVSLLLAVLGVLLALIAALLLALK